MPFAHLWDTARMIAEQGPDVLVVEPPDLREAVIRLLVGARSTDGPALDRGSRQPRPAQRRGGPSPR